MIYMTNMWKQVSEDEKYIYEKIKLITRENGEDLLEDIYRYVKENSSKYYSNGLMHPGYGFIKEAIYKSESYVKGKIIDVNIPFSIKDKNNFFIEYLVYIGRKYLIEKHYRILKNILDKLDLILFNFTNYCRETSKYIKKICDKEGIKNYLLPIYPGYTNKINLYNGSGYHFANIIYYNNKYYLIDITYSQFFYKDCNNLERIGIVNVSGCNPGRFMLFDDANKNIAINLLKNGYIELNEELLKRYLDAFTISFRNGLYYENTNDFSFKTNYTIDDYVSFLKGNDNQVKHEGYEYLGLQKRPLKKKILFK